MINSDNYTKSKTTIKAAKRDARTFRQRNKIRLRLKVKTMIYHNDWNKSRRNVFQMSGCMYMPSLWKAFNEKIKS